jgi:hypothetical protein
MPSKAALSMTAVLLVAVALGSGYVGLKLGARYQINASCCQIPLSQSLVVSAKEILGLTTFYSQMGQDKWVSEAIFPDVKNGFLLDMGSGDDTLISNTKALEQKAGLGSVSIRFPEKYAGSHLPTAKKCNPLVMFQQYHTIQSVSSYSYGKYLLFALTH